MSGLKLKRKTNLGGLDGAVTSEKYSWFAGNPRITSDTVLIVWKVEKGAKIQKQIIAAYQCWQLQFT